MMMNKTKTTNIANISNDLVFAQSRFTSIEAKIIDSLITTIPRDLKTFRMQTIKITEIEKSYKKHMTLQEVSEITRNLIEKSVRVKNKGKDYTDYSMFASIGYKHKERTLSFKFNNQARPIITQFSKGYLRLKLHNILELNSKYAIILYKILRTIKNARKTKKDTHPIQEIDLKKLYFSFDVEKKYNRFFDFQKRILKPAVDEIRTKTDLKITYETIKEKRKVVAIKFKFLEQDNRKKLDKKTTKLTKQDVVDLDKMQQEIDEKADKKQAKTTKKYQKKSDKIGSKQNEISNLIKSYESNKTFKSLYKKDGKTYDKMAKCTHGELYKHHNNEMIKITKQIKKCRAELDELTGQSNMKI